MTNPEQAHRNDEYLEQYPNAIQDTNKAHEVALAGKEHRDQVAVYREVGKALVRWSEDGTSQEEAMDEAWDTVKTVQSTGTEFDKMKLMH